jgi:hypothetical protein
MISLITNPKASVEQRVLALENYPLMKGVLSGPAEPRVVTALVDILTDKNKNEKVARAAIPLLQRMHAGNPGLARAMINAIRNKNENMRLRRSLMNAFAMEPSKDPVVQDQVLEVLVDASEDKTLRSLGVEVLKKTPPRAPGALKKLLNVYADKKDNIDIRYLISDVFRNGADENGQFNPIVFDGIVNLMTDPQQDLIIRSRSANLLIGIKDFSPQVIKKMVTLLENPDTDYVFMLEIVDVLKNANISDKKIKQLIINLSR